MFCCCTSCILSSKKWIYISVCFLDWEGGGKREKFCSKDRIVLKEKDKVILVCGACSKELRNRILGATRRWKHVRFLLPFWTSIYSNKLVWSLTSKFWLYSQKNVFYFVCSFNFFLLVYHHSLNSTFDNFIHSFWNYDVVYLSTIHQLHPWPNRSNFFSYPNGHIFRFYSEGQMLGSTIQVFGN